MTHTPHSPLRGDLSHKGRGKNLIKNKPFWALFGTQLLGAFNDNFFRTAFVTLVTYHLSIFSETTRSLFISAAFGLFMLPFFLFSPLAGQLCDRFDKSKIIRFVKGAEILIISLSAYGFIHKNPYFLLAALFCMGTHSAFFGPAKYGLLPEILSKDKLLIGNGYIEAGTFLAIMGGTLTGALMIHSSISSFVLSLQLLSVAMVGFWMSWGIPAVPGQAPHLKIRFSWTAEMMHLFHFTRKTPRVFKAIIAISWFWLVGALLLAQLPSFAKDILNVKESAFIFLLLLFTIGLGTGSILCAWVFKGEITTKSTPLLALLMIPLLFDISSFTSPLGETPLSFFSFVTSGLGLRLAADIFCLSFVGGLFIVPLYTFIQAHVAPSHLSQVIALNNILNAGFMVFASFASFCLLSLEVSIPTLIGLASVGQIIVTFYIIRILPDEDFKKILYKILRFFFHLEVKGLENYKKAGKRVILIANHTSYLDALLIAAILPEKPLFAINRFTAKKWWVRPFLVLAKVFPIDPLYPYALREVIEEAKAGHKVLIFPEGRVTLTGSLMKIYEGPGMVAEKVGARLLPIRIEGAQYTFFTLLKGKLPRKFFPKITITVLPSQKLSVNPELVGRDRRRALNTQLYDIMSKMIFTTSPLNTTLFSSLQTSRRLYGGGLPILEDITRAPLTYNRLLFKVFTLARYLERKTTSQEVVGLMLPNTNTLIVSFWALQAIGRVPALLNYSSGSASLCATAHLAGLRKVYTSRQFVEKARLQEAVVLLKQNNIQVHYLEDEEKKIRIMDFIGAGCRMLFPKEINKDPNLPCVILFTSGSEGAPKSIPLTHRNLQANRYQLTAVVDFNEADRVMNTLPLFHAFGLMGGMILPLLSGIKTFHYVSPLHYRAIAELIYDTNATILFGTDTFLSGYGRVANAYDFHTLRCVFAGAEKLREETQALWFEKFGLRIFEGYGCTETSPVLSVNTPMHYKSGTVGRFLPGLTFRLDPVEGIEEGGRLWVKGPNVVRDQDLRSQGTRFRNQEKKLPPDTLIPDSWYDTGDIVSIDEDGYLTIKGRAKRFAKVGGETVSLSAVEEAIARLWPNYLHAVITCPDLKKGERLILYTTYSLADKFSLIAFWKHEGLSEVSLPKALYVLPTLPLLGSGKVDYAALSCLSV